MNRAAVRTVVIHGGIGVAWLWGDPTRTATPAYQPAIQLGRILHFGIYPVRSYGLVLIMLAVGTVISESRGHPGGWRIALALWWVWWSLMFVVAAIWHNGGISAPVFTLALAWYSWDKAVVVRPTARSR